MRVMSAVHAGECRRALSQLPHDVVLDSNFGDADGGYRQDSASLADAPLLILRHICECERALMTQL